MDWVCFPLTRWAARAPALRSSATTATASRHALPASPAVPPPLLHPLCVPLFTPPPAAHPSSQLSCPFLLSFRSVSVSLSLSLSLSISLSPLLPPSPLSRRPAPFIPGRSRLLRRARTTSSHLCGKPVWCDRWRVAGSTRRPGLAGRRCARATADAAARATRGQLVTVPPSSLPLTSRLFQYAWCV